MKVNLGEGFEFDLFSIEEVRGVEKLAEKTNGAVYSWKTEGQHNWLQKGFTVVDVLGLTIIPKGLPDLIDMPDDEEEESTAD
jgi:hypothetical protein